MSTFEPLEQVHYMLMDDGVVDGDTDIVKEVDVFCYIVAEQHHELSETLRQ